MIVLGLIGRPDVPECHDAAACLIIDGHLVGALEQERISRRRYAQGEGPEDAVRVLLAAHGVHPSDVDAIGYAWADVPAPEGRPFDGRGDLGGVSSDALTATILPTLADRLGTRNIAFFDHHLCHAAQVYWLNPYDEADILVVDGWGGDGSTSLYRAFGGDLRLLERYPVAHSLGVFYEAAAYFAGLGWDAAGKLMGLSSYARPTDRRFMSFDPAAGRFSFSADGLAGAPAEALAEDRLARTWLETFERTVFPYAAGSGNTFDYAVFAADVQATLEDLGLELVRRLKALSGQAALLLAGGVSLNAHMNRLIARNAGYRFVSGTAAPHDSGAAIGAAFLAASAFGEPEPLMARNGIDPIFLGPPVEIAQIESALTEQGIGAQAMEPEKLRVETARALARGEIVAWFDGRCEFGPRALGARSLLAAPERRATLDRLNRIKGRAPWRPAALSLLGDGFPELGLEPPVDGLTDYMLCAHRVGESGWRRAAAGVHVDGTTRAQRVREADDGFGALLAAVAAETGSPALINTSLNTGGRPLTLTPAQAVELMRETPEVDLLVMPPYVARRS